MRMWGLVISRATFLVAARGTAHPTDTKSTQRSAQSSHKTVSHPQPISTNVAPPLHRHTPLRVLIASFLEFKLINFPHLFPYSTITSHYKTTNTKREQSLLLKASNLMNFNMVFVSWRSEITTHSLEAEMTVGILRDPLKHNRLTESGLVWIVAHNLSSFNTESSSCRVKKMSKFLKQTLQNKH